MSDSGNGNILHGLSLFTVKLIDLLKAGKVGDMLTDEELSAACGRNVSVKGDGYGNLASAIRNVRRNHGLVWDRIRGAGVIECKGFDGKLSIVDSDRKSIGRRAKRSLSVMRTIDAADVPNDKRTQLNVRLAQMGVLSAMASGNTTKAMEARTCGPVIDHKRLLSAIVDSNVK